MRDFWWQKRGTKQVLLFVIRFPLSGSSKQVSKRNLDGILSIRTRQRCLETKQFSLGYRGALHKKVLPHFFFFLPTASGIEIYTRLTKPLGRGLLVNCHSQACGLNVFGACSVTLGKKSALLHRLEGFKKVRTEADVMELQIAAGDNAKINDAGCVEAASRFKDSHNDKPKSNGLFIAFAAAPCFLYALST
jgi:hypothetical protein